MKSKSLDQEWREFSEIVFAGQDISAVQRTEMKRAFFAGAFVVLLAMREIGEPEVSEREGIDYLVARMQEVEMYVAQVAKGAGNMGR